MQIFKPLRVRFALWVAALLLATLIAFGTYLYMSLARSLTAAIDEALEFNAAQVIAALDVANGHLRFAGSIPQDNEAASELQERGFTIWLFDRADALLQAVGRYRNLPAIPQPLAAAHQQRATFVTVTEPTKGDVIRIYTVPLMQQGQLIGILQVAHNLEGLQETLQRLLKALLLGAPIVTTAAAMGSYFLAAHALRPIDQLTRTARRISAENLTERLHLPATDDEVGRLAATFDAMLARLALAFQRERQFTADASHELRTPLAAMQAILTVVREQVRTPAEYEQALADLSYETERLRALVESLLHLARSDKQLFAVHTSVDLSILLQDVTAALAPLAESKGLAITTTIDQALLLCGDEDGLIRLFVNLLDNAIKYTDQGAITLTAQHTNHELVVVIADTGPGIAAAHLPHIFARFYRVETARASHGAGLGLAIAREIAHAHGGGIEAHSTPGVGTTFTVRLPAQRV